MSKMVTAQVFELYDENQQGRLVAEFEVSTYKWAPRNAIDRYVKDTPGLKPGAYATVGDGKFSLWLVRTPAATVQSLILRSGGEYGRGEVRHIDVVETAASPESG